MQRSLYASNRILNSTLNFTYGEVVPLTFPSRGRPGTHWRDYFFSGLGMPHYFPEGIRGGGRR